MSHEIKVKTTVEITITLTEGEAKALDAICGYGPEIFLKWFHTTHGKHYISKHEIHLESLFAKARGLGSALYRMQQDKAAFLKNNTNHAPTAPVLNPKAWRRWAVKLLKL